MPLPSSTGVAALVVCLVLLVMAGGARAHNDLLCPICVDSAEKVLPGLGTNSTDAEVVKVLGKVCGVLPEHEKHECKEGLETLIKAVGKAGIVDKYSPRALCSLVGACRNECCTTWNHPEQIHISFGRNHGDMSVSWVTLNPKAAATVAVGTSPTSLTTTYAGTTTTYTKGGWIGYVHTVHITGLDPGRKYWYQPGTVAGDILNIIPVYHFTTRGANARNVRVTHPGTGRHVCVAESVAPVARVAVVGDMGASAASDQTNARLNAARVASPQAIDAVVHLGDISYADGYEPVMDEYFRKIQGWAAFIPYMTMPGNHEGFFAFTPYKTRMGNLASIHNSPDSLFYSYDHHGVHWIALDTEGPVGSIHNFAPGDQEFDWFVKDVAAAAANRRDVPWIAVAGHRAYRCLAVDNIDCKERSEYLRRNMEAVFEKYDVDVVLQGHVHHYERTHRLRGGSPMPIHASNAPMYIVQGASGTREGIAHGFPDTPLPGLASSFTGHGFGILETGFANGNHTLNWKFIDDEDGSVYDEVTLSKPAVGC